MKTTVKISALVMALLLIVGSLVACGGGGVTGETQTWGNITVLVPNGMTLKGGSILDEQDPNVVNISKTDDAMKYFLITIVADEESAKSNIDLTREINEGCEDVSVEAGSTWTGVKYQFLGDVFQVYGKVGEKYVMCQSYGYAADSDTTKAILGSLKVA